MSSIICQNFVQNAWKKELCSNCFKSKDEHKQPSTTTTTTTTSSVISNNLKPISNIKTNKSSSLTSKVTSSLLNKSNSSSANPTNTLQTTPDGKRESNNISITSNNTETKSIIKTKTTTSPTKQKRSVNFKTNLAQVIGYGGEDWSEEEEDVVAYEESSDTDSPTEDEKELNRLTKSNTDFNTNLTCKKLQLGKPQVDSEGRKQTLLVQVTPFGQDYNRESSVKQKISMCNKFISTQEKVTKQFPISTPDKETKQKFTSTSDKGTKQQFSSTQEKVVKSSTEESKIKSVDVVDHAENIKLKSYFVKVDSVKVETENEKFKEVTEELNDLNETKEVKSFKEEVRQHVIQEEKSLLDEITETLERNKNPIIKKIVQKEIILTKPTIPKEVPKVTGTKLSRTPVIKEKKTFQSSKCLNLQTPVLDKSEKDIKDDVKDPFDDKDSANGSSGLDDSSSHCGSEDSNSNDTDSSLEVKSYENIDIPSRELVGEPDGRAESDGTDEPVPALPSTPPPSNGLINPPSNGLLITPEKAKPKIPTKPSTILIRKPPSIMSMTNTVNQVILSTFNSDKSNSQKNNITLQKRDSNGSDISKKRKAPKPPNEEIGNSIYTRKTVQGNNNDCPVVREKEKRERASSCTPKLPVVQNPEPAPRRSLSLSSDSLASTGVEDKKKRGKFSLKKLLRMGNSNSKTDNEEKPLPKPRLVIVHPLDLKPEGIDLKEQEYVNTAFLQEQIKLQHGKESQNQNRPPPPPRNYENYEKPDKLPPKTSQIKHLQMSGTPTTPTEKKKPMDSVYANIGEVRNSITPHKPQRTASMREIKEGVMGNQNKHMYEPVMTPGIKNLPHLVDKRKDVNSKTETEHVYDYIGNRSSSPECDSKSIPKVESNAGGIVGNGNTHNGHNNGMSRSVSLTYCGSETESEIYSPYSYYGSESEVAEDEPECCYGNGLGSTGRTHKLRSKKGRSIVHKNLEDNYGAVVIANHEALAQVLENIQQIVHIPLPLRALKTAENLRWNDFQLRTTPTQICSSTSSTNNMSPSLIVIGNCSFQQATWNQQNVTLMITIVPNSPSCSLGTFILQPVTEFSDLVPSTFIPQGQKPQQHDLPVQATISVLPHLQINSMFTIGDVLKSNKSSELNEIFKCSTVILLQLVNGLKALQAQGVEELPLSLNSFVLAKEIEKQETHSRLYILQPNEEAHARSSKETGTLCLIVSKVLNLLPLDSTLQRLIYSLLSSERAITLSQVKSVLEFSLWGPSDVALGSTQQEREFVLQRWLDLQRATVLHGLVCTKVQLTVYEECHLLFLVRSNAKMMCDASLLLESMRSQKIY